MLFKIESSTTYDNVEFGVNVDQFAVVVDDGQRGNPFVDEFPESLDNGHRMVADFDIFVTPDAEVVDRLREVLGLR